MVLAFIIPVKSKTITSDWDYFSRLVNRCIGSICKQTNTNFKVIVSCHEIPETNYKNDSRVDFIKVDFTPPILKNDEKDLWKKRQDKGKKIKFAADYAMGIGASYVMTVDSDDCISNRICEFVLKNGNDSISGWYLKKGYLYVEGKAYLYLNVKNFNEICGSCIIIKPEIIDLMYKEYREYFWFYHERRTFENGQSLLPLPFPGATYSMVNGTNIKLDHQELKERKEFNLFKMKSIITLIRRLRKYSVIPKVFVKNEFNIYDV